jgi:hypothetical protein
MLIIVLSLSLSLSLSMQKNGAFHKLSLPLVEFLGSVIQRGFASALFSQAATA